MNTPKDYIGKYWDSVFQNIQTEIVWNNIILILSRTGDYWRTLTWEEYKNERINDAPTDKSGFCEFQEKPLFAKALPYTSSEKAASDFTKK